MLSLLLTHVRLSLQAAAPPAWVWGVGSWSGVVSANRVRIDENGFLGRGGFSSAWSISYAPGHMQTSTRRKFFKTSVLSLAAASLPLSWSARGIEPFERTEPARLLLSLAAYSFRQSFRTGSGGAKAGAGPRTLDMFEFMDYCAEHGCVGSELTSYYFPSNPGREYFLRVRRHAFLRGLPISGTAVGNVFTGPRGDQRDQQLQMVKTWIDHAATMGAPHVRIFAGNQQAGMSKEEAMDLCVEAIEECCAYAGDRGIVLGLENHGGIVAEPDDLLAIVRRVQSPWFGINLDTGNFHTDDPYGDVARCAPYAVNVQLKVEMRRRGQEKEPADLERVVRILRDARYQGYVALEYEAAEDPWEAVPRHLKRLQELLR
jgi:sugar phosphate isomerase/epimerase